MMCIHAHKFYKIPRVIYYTAENLVVKNCPLATSLKFFSAKLHPYLYAVISEKGQFTKDFC